MWEEKKERDARKWENKNKKGCVDGFEFPYDLGNYEEFILPKGMNTKRLQMFERKEERKKKNEE